MEIKKCIDCGKEFDSYLFGQCRCLKCGEKRYFQEKIDNIGTVDEDTSSDKVVICPYCKAYYEPVNDDTCSECFEDGYHDVVCEECGKTFELITEVNFSWETFRKE